MQLPNVWGRAKVTLRYYAGGLWHHMGEKDVFLWAQAIAFKVLVTFVPLIILSTGILGQLLRSEIVAGLFAGETPFEAVARIVRDLLPAYQSQQLIAFLAQFHQASGTLTFIGAAALFITAMTLFSTLRAVLANVFKEEWHGHRSILQGYLFDLRMVLQVGLFFILSVALVVFRREMRDAGVRLIEHVGIGYIWLLSGWQHAFDLIGLVLAFLISTAMFFQLIYFNPQPRPPRKSALIGALVTAALWELAKYGFTFYAIRVGSFGGVGIAAGTFGLIILLVFWAYYSGIMFIMGAITTLLHETRARMLSAASDPRSPSGIPDREEAALLPEGTPSLQERF